MNAAEPVKTRFKSLAVALDEIERLERQIVGLNGALVNKSAPASKTQTPIAPAVNQPPAAAVPPAGERPLASLSKREIADQIDLAHARGDKATTDRLWREYSARK